MLNIPCFQAPLAGYTDRAMRRLARRYGAPLTFAGVVPAGGACHRPLYDKPAFRVYPDEHPIGAQLLGTEPDLMAQGARTLCDMGYDVIDINLACPAPKVLQMGRGGEQLKDPEAAGAVVQAVRDAVSCPLLVKLRIGYDDTPASRKRFWRMCELAVHAGIDALTVHGRTVVQRFRGKADWDTIAEVKRRFPDVIVFGSGDLYTAQTGMQRLAESGIDGVVFARGAVGNPWIFQQFAAMHAGQIDPPGPDVLEQGRIVLEHFEDIGQLYGFENAATRFRKFAVGYAKRHPQRRRVQADLLSAATQDQFRAAVERWYGQAWPHR